MQICSCTLPVVIAYCTSHSQTELWVFAPHKTLKTVGFLWKRQSLTPSCPKLAFRKSLIGEYWWTKQKELMCECFRNVCLICIAALSHLLWTHYLRRNRLFMCSLCIELCVFWCLSHCSNTSLVNNDGSIQIHENMLHVRL